MGGITDLLNPVLSIGGSLVSGIFNNDNAMERQDAANAFSAQQYATRYQTTVKDMEAAGLNPMLAYQGISGSPPQGGIASSAGFPDLGSSFNASRQAGASEVSAGASAQQAENQSRLVDSTVKRVTAEVEKLKGDTNFETQQDILRQTAWQIHQLGAKLQEEGTTLGNSRKVQEQTVRKLVQDTALSQLDVKAAQSLNNLGREAGQLRPIIEMIVSVIRASK